MGKVGLLHFNIFFHTVLSEESIRTSEYVYLPQNSRRLCHISNFQWKRDVDVHFVVSRKIEERERQRETKRERQKERDREIETERQRWRQRQRQREKEREGQTNRESQSKQIEMGDLLFSFSYS